MSRASAREPEVHRWASLVPRRIREREQCAHVLRSRVTSVLEDLLARSFCWRRETMAQAALAASAVST